MYMFCSAGKLSRTFFRGETFIEKRCGDNTWEPRGENVTNTCLKRFAHLEDDKSGRDAEKAENANWCGDREEDDEDATDTQGHFAFDLEKRKEYIFIQW